MEISLENHWAIRYLGSIYLIVVKREKIIREA